MRLTSRLVRPSFSSPFVRNIGSSRIVRGRREEEEHVPSEADRRNLLKWRTCLVTNCSGEDKDLASMTCKSLARYGASVLVHGDNQQNVNKLVSSLDQFHETQKHGAIIQDFSIKANSESEMIERMGESVQRQVSNFANSLDVLIHTSQQLETACNKVINYPIKDFREVLDINLTLPFALTQKLLPSLEKGTNPSLILASSECKIIETEHGFPLPPHVYFISKFGTKASDMLTKMLSTVLDNRSIRVNSIVLDSLLCADNESRTVPFVWLSRANTKATGVQIAERDWLNRDPVHFTNLY